MGENGERLREKKMHAIRGSKDLYSRILGGIGKGSEDQPQLQYFNLAMDNVLKGLPDKILLIFESLTDTLNCRTIGYFLTNLINDPSSLKLQSRDQNLI
jgi:hypothetical protein